MSYFHTRVHRSTGKIEFIPLPVFLFITQTQSANFQKELTDTIQQTITLYYNKFDKE